jgi:hypothetical protein
MPSEHEPIDAHVKDGVVQVDPLPGDAARPPKARPGRHGSSFGCLVLPALVGLWLLIAGIWQLTGWQTLPPVGRFGALVLTGFGLSITLAVAAAIWLLLKLRRLFKNLQRDAISLAEQMKYMATMGREGYGRSRPDREAAPADPAALPEALDPSADAPADHPDSQQEEAQFPGEIAAEVDPPDHEPDESHSPDQHNPPDEPDLPRSPDRPAWRP